jgi:hypothetical protein
MKGAVIVDLRNVYREEELTRAGFDYIRIGTMPKLGKAAAAAAE